MALAVSLDHRRTDRKVADSPFEHALSTIKRSEPEERDGSELELWAVVID
ncbi:hypothetical protein ACODT3_39630 [Streptomyces sp. 4.24]